MKQKKKDGYRLLLDNLRAAARAEEPRWEESDWRRAVARATAQGAAHESAPARRAPARNLRWAWAGAAAVLVLGGGTVATVNLLHRPSGGGGPLESVRIAGQAPESAQDQLSLTYVSSESGLRVHWYFDKDFDWKEEK